MEQQPNVEVIGERKIKWGLVAAGVALILFAFFAFAAPFLFLEFLTVWAGIMFLFSGAMGIVTHVKARPLPGCGWALFMAILDILIGIIMIMHPFSFASLFPWLLGLFFIVFGAFEVGGTVPLGMLVPESRVIMVIAGLLTAAVGIMFIIWPASLSIWVAAFALIRGITLVAGGFTARVQ